MSPPIPRVKGVEFFGEWKSGKKLNHLPRHKNPGLEIVLLTKGELWWEVEGKDTELGADTLFYTLPWQEHGGVEELQPSSEILYVCISLAKKYPHPEKRFSFHPSFGFSPAEERALSSILAGNVRHAIPASPDAAWLFTSFFKIARTDSPFAASRARDTLKLLITDLAMAVTSNNEPRPRADEAERRVRQFLTKLAACYSEAWTLESMSHDCRLGRTQFAQLLKKHTGDSPITYLNRLRIAEAKRLILATDRSITEIAHHVGFNSSQYFATVFKEFTDMDARTFRAARGRTAKS